MKLILITPIFVLVEFHHLFLNFKKLCIYIYIERERETERERGKEEREEWEYRQFGIILVGTVNLQSSSVTLTDGWSKKVRAEICKNFIKICYGRLFIWYPKTLSLGYNSFIILPSFPSAFSLLLNYSSCWYSFSPSSIETTLTFDCKSESVTSCSCVLLKKNIVITRFPLPFNVLWSYNTRNSFFA